MLFLCIFLSSFQGIFIKSGGWEIFLKRYLPKSVFHARYCESMDWIWPTEVILFGQYFKIWENSPENLNFQDTFWVKNNLAAFSYGRISWSFIVASHRVCSLQFPHSLFACLAVISVVLSPFHSENRPRILKFIGQEKDSLLLLSAVTPFLRQCEPVCWWNGWWI